MQTVMTVQDERDCSLYDDGLLRGHLDPTDLVAKLLSALVAAEATRGILPRGRRQDIVDMVGDLADWLEAGGSLPEVRATVAKLARGRKGGA